MPARIIGLDDLVAKIQSYYETNIKTSSNDSLQRTRDESGLILLFGSASRR
jgi:hypothetical protein